MPPSINPEEVFLDQKWIDLVQKTLQRHLPNHTVCLFGSRATGVNLKPFSDIDLCITGHKKLSEKVLSALQEDFSESDLPYRVDIVSQADITPAFFEAIKNQMKVLQKGAQ